MIKTKVRSSDIFAFGFECKSDILLQQRDDIKIPIMRLRIKKLSPTTVFPYIEGINERI